VVKEEKEKERELSPKPFAVSRSKPHAVKRSQTQLQLASGAQ
jgi:hypothetical protein